MPAHLYLFFVSFCVWTFFLPLAITADLRDVHFSSKWLLSNNSTAESNAACIRALDNLTDDLFAGKDWAVKVVDMWGKWPAGFLSGKNRIWIGEFESCLEIVPPYNFSAQYCLVGIGKTNRQQPDPYECLLPADLTRVGICLPSSCTHNNVKAIIKESVVPLFGNESFDISIDAEDCHTANESIHLSTFNIVTIVIVLLILGLCIIGSIMDKFTAAKKYDFIKCFSLISSWQQLMRTDNKNVQGIDSIKGIIAFMVTKYHFLLFVSSGVAAGNSDILNITFSWPIKFEQSFLDFFFLNSGAFCVISFFRQQKTKQHYDPALSVFIRYARLYLPAGFLILLKVGLQEKYHTGPLYHTWTKRMQTTQCEGNAWQFFFLYHNLVRGQSSLNVCLPHFWYITVDMQLFILAQIILLTSRLKYWMPALVAAVMCVIIAFCDFYAGYFLGSLSQVGCFRYPGISQSLIIGKPYIRGSPFFVGMILGYVILRHKAKPYVFSKSKNAILWSCCIAAIVVNVVRTVVVNKSYPDFGSPLQEAIMTVYLHLVLPIACSWIVFCLWYNKAPLLSNILSYGVFKFIGKINIELYYTHLTVLEYLVFSTRDIWHVTTKNEHYYFYPVAVHSVFWSVVFFLFFTHPWKRIVETYFSKIRILPIPTFFNRKEVLPKEQCA